MIWAAAHAEIVIFNSLFNFHASAPRSRCCSLAGLRQCSSDNDLSAVEHVEHVQQSSPPSPSCCRQLSLTTLMKLTTKLSLLRNIIIKYNHRSGNHNPVEQHTAIPFLKWEATLKKQKTVCNSNTG